MFMNWRFDAEPYARVSSRVKDVVSELRLSAPFSGWTRNKFGGVHFPLSSFESTERTAIVFLRKSKTNPPPPEGMSSGPQPIFRGFPAVSPTNKQLCSSHSSPVEGSLARLCEKTVVTDASANAVTTVERISPAEEQLWL